ncbi:MAG: DUF2061 domain-containing protein [Candidatus Kuenenbacteria bacterium]
MGAFSTYFKEDMFHELHSRSILKSITWLVVGFLVAFFVLLIFTRDWKMSVIDALIIQLVKTVFFYIHERIWNRSNFGQELRIKKIKK